MVSGLQDSKLSTGLKYNLLQRRDLKSLSLVGRYAPSPTGPLHLGNARTALLAWLQVRLAGGRFIMRMDDLDLPRVKAGSAAQCLDDLRWLGLDWDEGPDVGGPHAPYEQSQRSDLYEKALSVLHAESFIYRCYCSRRDIREAASAPHQPGHVLRYPGTCREREPDKIPTLPPAWRFKVDNLKINMSDGIVGNYSQRLADEVGDFVVKRRDGLFAYQLASVVDDIAMGVTDIVRGADLLDSAPRQLALVDALGAARPVFWHVPMLCDAKGVRLSKRNGADSLQDMWEQHQRPEAVVGELAASLGLLAHESAKPKPISAADLLATLSAEH